MEGKEKIRVVWIAQFSNPKVRKQLAVKPSLVERVVRYLRKQPYPTDLDYCQWVTNAIEVFERYEDIELHVIAPYSRLSKKTCIFVINGVHYYFFRDEDSTGWEFVLRNINKSHTCKFRGNKKYVKNLIEAIKPDIVHLFGAENLNNAPCLLEVPQSIPTIVQLQTLLSSPGFEAGSGMSHREFTVRLQCEQSVIKGAKYVGVGGARFIDTIRSVVKPDAVIMKMPLALSEPIDLKPCEKEFDFVYFARNINKAADDAIEAFACALAKRPSLTLDMVGQYSADYKLYLDNRINELGIGDSISFEGSLPTHEDVIRQIRKARVALLPLKVDIVSGTIREAMSNGIPVVTTITEGTPSLNNKRPSVLLSERGDYEDMAYNMLRLLEDESLYKTLRENAAQTLTERADNNSRMKQSVEVYRACINHYNNGTPIPEGLLL